MKDYDDRLTKSNVRLGNCFKQSLNRIDTTSLSAHSPKSLDNFRGAERLKDLTAEMRKTNFILGFKPDDSSKNNN